jgi:hypothetical protein
MNDSKASVVVGGQGSFDRLVGVVVVPDRGGQGQDALHDTHPDPGRGVAAVPFEIELPLEGVVDRLDDLPQWLEEAGAGPFGLTLAGWTQQLQPGVGEFGLEPAPVVVLVRDHDLPAPPGGQLGVGVEDPEQGLAFVGPLLR